MASVPAVDSELSNDRDTRICRIVTPSITRVTLYPILSVRKSNLRCHLKILHFIMARAEVEEVESDVVEVIL